MADSSETQNASSSALDISEPSANPRGIPSFPFTNSVSAYVSTAADVEPTLRRFQEMIAKYQFMEGNVAKRAAGLREKLPEMEGTLWTVRFLMKQKNKSQANANGDDGEDDDGTKSNAGSEGDLSTTFSLSETLYARAVITPSTIDEVYLWLGANVMVAYPLAEAEEMLSGRADKARQTLKACEEDLEFLRVQITTVEVATARVYNWDVMERRKMKERGEGDQDGDEEGIDKSS